MERDSELGESSGVFEESREGGEVGFTAERVRLPRGIVEVKDPTMEGLTG